VRVKLGVDGLALADRTKGMMIAVATRLARMRLPSKTRRRVRMTTSHVYLVADDQLC
jgi:hypothetical protein